MTIAPAKPSVAVALPADTAAFDRAVGQPYQPYRTTLLTPDEVWGFSTQVIEEIVGRRAGEEPPVHAVVLMLGPIEAIKRINKLMIVRKP